MRNDRASAAAVEYLRRVADRARQEREAREAQISDGIKLYNSIPKRTLSFGALRCTIPPREYRALVTADPELEAPDRETQSRAWVRLERAGVLKHFRAR